MTDAAATGLPVQPPAVRVRSRTLRTLLRRKAFVAGSAGMALIVALALLAPVIAPHDPLRQDLARSLVPPVWDARGTWEHPLGTDALGRDVASRLLYGARNSLLIAFFAVLIASGLGLLAGLVAGFFGGAMEAVLMRLGDMQLAFPFILLAIVVLGVTSDRSLLLIVLVLGIPGWIIYARVVRSRVLAERDKDYVTAARAIGAGRLRQLRRYVLPSVWQVVLVIALLDFGFIILLESTLSFLGFGLTPPTPSWGSMMAEGRRSMIVAPWLAVIPGLTIMATVLVINLAADGAADVLDPKLRRGVFRRWRLPFERSPATSRPERADVASGLEAPGTAEPAGGGSAIAASATAVQAPTAADATLVTAAATRTREAVPDDATGDAAGPAPLLEVIDLHVAFAAGERTIRAVRGASLRVDRGQALGIVGESGSGKSVTALSIIQLLESPGRVTSGRILFDGQDLARIPDREMVALRGERIGMIFQNPSSSLNPVLTVGAQMVETIREHHAAPGGEARGMAEAALLDVGIGDPRRVMSRYPFQMSGGMNQRIMIALAMLTQPDLLIADEPTTALDVTTQAQVLEQLVEVTRAHHTALILISHDIALVSEHVDHVTVMYAGRVCESGPVERVIHEPSHPYTQALLDSVPRADLDPDTRLSAIPGELPDPASTPLGCPFASRCRHVMDVCSSVDPPLQPVEPGHLAACHLHGASREEAVAR
jgi:peptide/nickel transport system permease protein